MVTFIKKRKKRKKKKERFQINNLTLYLKKLEKEQTKLKSSRRKKKTKIRVKINRYYKDNRKKINENKSCFFENTSKIGKLLARLQKKDREDLNKYN